MHSAPGNAGHDGSDWVRLEVGTPNDATFAAVTTLVADYAPFSRYAFSLMVAALTEQLRHGGNVLALHQGVLRGYAGWRRVDATAAQAWHTHQGELPPSDWSGHAAIVSVVVVREPRLVPTLLRGVSHQCAGLPVYRLRSFDDGRPDMRRPPIVGRTQRFA